MTTIALNYIKESVEEMPRINWKIIFFVGLAMMFVCLMFYVLQINDLARGSYLIGSYQRKISDLSGNNKNLEVGFAESSFLGEAQIKAEQMDFQKTTSVKYIRVLENSVAVVTKK